MSFSFPHPFMLGQENQLNNTPQIHGDPSGLQEGELFPRKRKRTQTEVLLNAPQKKCKTQYIADNRNHKETFTLPLGNAHVSTLNLHPAPPVPSSSNCFLDLPNGNHDAELGQGVHHVSASDLQALVQDGLYGLSPLDVGQAFDIPPWVQGDSCAILDNRYQDTHTVTGPNLVLFGNSQQSETNQYQKDAPLPPSSGSLPISTQFTPGLMQYMNQSLSLYDVLPVEEPISRLARSKRNGKVRKDPNAKCRIENVEGNGLAPYDIDPFTSLANSTWTDTTGIQSSMPTWVNDTSHFGLLAPPYSSPASQQANLSQIPGRNIFISSNNLVSPILIPPPAQMSLVSSESSGITEPSQLGQIKGCVETPVSVKDVNVKGAGGRKAKRTRNKKKKTGCGNSNIQTGTYRRIEFVPDPLSSLVSK